HRGSGRQRFQRAQAAGELEASLKAAYGKLARVPPALSSGLLAGASARLAGLRPPTPATLPARLGGLQVLFLDGKKVKHVAKRLRALRKVRGQVLGGKLVVALAGGSGLAVALASDPDGEAGGTPLGPRPVAQGRRGVGGRAPPFRRLHLAVLAGGGGDQFPGRAPRRGPFPPRPPPPRPPRHGCPGPLLP